MGTCCAKVALRSCPVAWEVVAGRDFERSRTAIDGGLHGLRLVAHRKVQPRCAEIVLSHRPLGGTVWNDSERVGDLDRPPSVCGDGTAADPAIRALKSSGRMRSAVS